MDKPGTFLMWYDTRLSTVDFVSSASDTIQKHCGIECLAHLLDLSENCYEIAHVGVG